MLGHACGECLRAGGAPLARVLRPIIALAVPDGELAYDILLALLGTPPSKDQAAVSKGKGVVLDGEVERALCEEWGCWPAAVRRIGDPAVLGALLRAISAKPPPTCPITLEDLVINGNVDRDVAIIIQRPAGASPPDARPTDVHVFLYRRQALERWFSDRPAAPTNPLTRQSLNTSRDYIPIS